MPRPEGIIFDLDGTLLATEALALRSGQIALAQMGHDISPAFMVRLIGTDEVTGLRMLSEHLGHDVDRHHLIPLWDAVMDRLIADEGIALRPKVAQVLAHVEARGLPCAIATSGTRARAMLKLAAAGIAERFAHMITLDDVSAPKPAPEPYLKAAALIGVDPVRCVAFEDSETGARSARAAGLVVVQVPDLVHSEGVHAHHLARDMWQGAVMAGLVD